MATIAMYYLTKKATMGEEFLEEMYSLDMPFYINKNKEDNWYYWKLGQKPHYEGNNEVRRGYPDYWTSDKLGKSEFRPENLFISTNGHLMIAYRERLLYPKLGDYSSIVLANNGKIGKWSSIKVKRLSFFKKMIQEGWRYPVDIVDEDDLMRISKILDEKEIELAKYPYGAIVI